MARPRARASCTVITLLRELNGTSRRSSETPSPCIRSPRPVREPAENSRVRKGWFTIWKFSMVRLPVKSGPLPFAAASEARPGRMAAMLSLPPRMLSKANRPRSRSPASPAVIDRRRPCGVISIAPVRLAVLDNCPDSDRVAGRCPIPDRSRLKGATDTPSRMAKRSRRALIWNGPSMLSSSLAGAAPLPGAALVPLRPIMDPSSDAPRSV